MGQVLFADRVGALQHVTGNVTLAPSILTIGGQQYTTLTTIQVALPSLTANTRYQVYAVLNAAVVELRISQNENSVGPAGFNNWKLVGAFYSSATSTFDSFVSKSGETKGNIVRLLSGSGTYVSSSGLKALRVRMAGGGGGAAGGGVNGTAGSGNNGNPTSFGSLIAGAGIAGLAGASPGGLGGTNTFSGIGFEVPGGRGGGYNYFSGGGVNIGGGGGQGGSNPFGGGGGGGIEPGNHNGQPGATNTGAGGGGGGASSSGAAVMRAGAGAGSGGYIEAILPPGSYAYSVGTGGSGGGAGTAGTAGGAGADGIILIEEIRPSLEDLKDL